MDLRKLKTLIDLVSESDVSELEITEAEGKVRIVKGGTVAPPPMTYAVAPPVAPQAPAPVAAPAAPPPVKGFVVKSPMVGTFYRSATPGGEPLVDVGSSVKEGDTLCIIEAMKILNEIDSEQVGSITQVLVENGQPVEFGQPLFVIE